MDISIQPILAILTNPRNSRWISASLMTAEAVLGGLVIWRVQYTEIDWKTYMQQVRLFLDGQRDYTFIKGDTGPLVYPAIHLYIYSALYHLTDGGTNILLAQGIFHVLYLVTLAFVLACYRKVNAPPWLLAPLVLSKRLHSIFLLRLFNDAWASLGLWVAIYSFQRRRWLAGALAWSFGLGVKMILLLAAPAVGAILLQGAGPRKGLLIGMILPQLQLTPALPFIIQGKSKEYLSGAFDFGRQFMFKWTVNWRFVGEDIFLSRTFAFSLLFAHVCVLLFFLETRWVRPTSSGIIDFVRKYRPGWQIRVDQEALRNLTPVFVMDAMLGSTAIGLLCARSLHYQFYAYLAWATPYLLWRSGLGPIWVVGNWAMQEVAWLKYPSTNLSSGVVVFQLFLAIASLWWGSRRPHVPSPAGEEAVKKGHLE